ncbi:hypothetical protein [Vibrio aestuarianus]|uniref:hypothetical protein n=1 Tax=Vibrio aestuarianus TaxID=28171 RepID=UPI00237CF540|nr:hypothetical protein [Vibrio aestuarianus]MDE1335104.1 hypothetical protein [Vibrio aestuarianus]
MIKPFSRKNLVPNPKVQLSKFRQMLKERLPFTFIRFSDGETEILFNRYLEINSGRTFFKGKEYNNNYPDYDSKVFNPGKNSDIRNDLLKSALFASPNYYKGIPASHNGKICEREFMVRLNGGLDHYLTFSDLFLNSNYLEYRQSVVNEFNNYRNIYVVANYRTELCGFLRNANLISIPDNFFSNYQEVFSSTYNKLSDVEPGSLILSSASSLTNIVGHKLFLSRKDITFIDIGTSLNDYLGLDLNTRIYHSSEKGPISSFLLRFKKGHQIKW